MDKIIVKQDGSLEVTPANGKTFTLPQYAYTLTIANQGQPFGIEVMVKYKDNGVPRYIELSVRDGISFS